MRRCRLHTTDAHSAPGTLPAHYAPRAAVELVDGGRRGARAIATLADGRSGGLLAPAGALDAGAPPEGPGRARPADRRRRLRARPVRAAARGRRRVVSTSCSSWRPRRKESAPRSPTGCVAPRPRPPTIRVGFVSERGGSGRAGRGCLRLGVGRSDRAAVAHRPPARRAARLLRRHRPVPVRTQAGRRGPQVLARDRGPARGARGEAAGGGLQQRRRGRARTAAGRPSTSPSSA